MTDVVRFVRQLGHDLRNQLNAAELQSAYIREVTEDEEMKSEVQRLRGMLGEMGNSLQKLTASLATVRLTEMPYEAVVFFEDLKQKLETLHSEQSGDVDWEVNAGDSLLEIDPQLMQAAMLELFANAFQHERAAGRISVRAEVKDGLFVVRLREPKAHFAAATDNWGREPFQKVKHGHYGLGLHRVRTIIEAHRGRLAVRYDLPSSTLVTTVELPVAGKS